MSKNFFEKLFPTRVTRILLILYLASFVWWITIFVRGVRETTEVYVYGGVTFSAVALFAAILAFYTLRSVQQKNHFRKSCLFIGAGLIAFAIGSLIFMYYNIVLHVPVPYPSFIELGYGLAPLFWIIGLFYGIRAFRMSSVLMATFRKFLFFFAPFLLVSVSYFLFFVVAQKESFDFTSFSVKLFFDVYYLLAEVCMSFLVFILVYGLFFRLIDKKFTQAIALLSIGFALMYFADFAFAYLTSHDLYFVGHWNDVLYISAMFFLSLGLCVFVGRVCQEQKSTSV